MADQVRRQRPVPPRRFGRGTRDFAQRSLPCWQTDGSRHAHCPLCSCRCDFRDRTIEFVVVGLIPGVAADLGVSISTAGLVSLYALSITLW